MVGTALFMVTSLTVGRRIVFNLIRWTNDNFASSIPIDPLVSPVEGINSNSPATGELAEIAGKLPSADYKFEQLVLEIVNSLPFQMKRASEGGQVTATIVGRPK